MKKMGTIRALCLLTILFAWPNAGLSAGELYYGYMNFGDQCCTAEGEVTACNANPQTRWDELAGAQFTCDDHCSEFMIWLAVHCTGVNVDCYEDDCDDCYVGECDEELPCCSGGAECVEGYCEG